MTTGAEPNMTSLAEVGVILANTLTTNKKTDIYTQMAALHRILSSIDDETMDGEKKESKESDDLAAYFPSLKACLVKLISSSEPNTCKHNGEILQSMAIRQEWIGCVVLLLALDSNSNEQSTTQGNAGINLSTEHVISQCSDVALGKKAGTSVPALRSAAMDLLVNIFSDINHRKQNQSKKLKEMRTSICAPWSTLTYDIIHFIYKYWFRISQTNGSLRASAVRLSNSILLGCIFYQKSLQDAKKEDNYVLGDLIPEKSLILLIKLIKRSVDDKSIEVRMETARLSSSLSEATIVSNRTKGAVSRSKTTIEPFNLQYLDELLQISLQNIDDVSTGVASSWAEATARCLSVAITYGGKYGQSESTPHHDLDGDIVTEEDTKVTSSSKSIQSDIFSKFKAFSDIKKELSIKSCFTLVSSLNYLCEFFVKTGGEAVANGCGGTYSGGGRKARVATTLVIVQLMRLSIGPFSQSKGSIDTRTVKSVLLTVMNMIGPSFERQMVLTDAYVSGSFDVATLGNESSYLSAASVNKTSFNDAAIARLCVSRVLRHGLGCLLIESNQQTLLADLAEYCQKSSQKQINAPNSHQLQCALIEMSHLVTALGDASIGVSDILFTSLINCLSHADYGVRYEAATALASIASTLPVLCSTLTQKLMDTVRASNDSISDLAQTRMDNKRNSPIPENGGKKRSTSPSPAGKFVTFQYALHGHALALSMFLHEANTNPVLVSEDNLFDLVGIAEILILCQVDEKITMVNPGAACTCVRAGYSILSAALSSGPTIEQHVERIGKCWTRTSKCIVDGSKQFGVAHDVICLEALLSSIVAFLRFRSEFLLTIPGLLNRITLCLETLLALIIPGGRLGAEPGNVAAETRLDNVKATMFEAFAWLPPGCFPVASETLYRWSLEQFLDCTEKDIESSLLTDALSREDNVIGIQSIANAANPLEVGYWSDFTEALVFLSSSPAEHREREGIMHAPIWRRTRPLQDDDYILGTSLLGPSHCFENCVPPTPLHNIGVGASWKEPPVPLAASKVRLIDSSIHIFATIFGLLDGRKQEQAMISLHELMPAAGLAVGKYNMGNALLTESEKNIKNKQEKVASVNLVALLLLSIKSLPLHEAATSTDKGPPWMRHASDILFQLLLSSYHIVSRGSAEALSSLALSTRGIGGGVHWFQQMIIDNMEDLSKGNFSQGKTRKGSSQTFLRSKAASMIALASFQRQAYRVSMASKASNSSSSKQSEVDFLLLSPLSSKLRSCLLSSIESLSFDPEAFEEEIYGILSLQIFLSNSSIAKVHAYGGVSKLQQDRVQILSKIVTLTEKLFLNAWYDTGIVEKPSSLISMLASFMRLFTSLSIESNSISESHPFLIERLCSMATSIMNNFNHPVLTQEYIAFIEVTISRNSNNIPDHIINEALSLISEGFISKEAIDLVAGYDYAFLSATCLKSITKSSKTLASRVLAGNDWHGRLCSLIERTGQKHFRHSNYYRSVVCGRQFEIQKLDIECYHGSLLEVIDELLAIELKLPNKIADVPRKLLLYKAIVTGSTETDNRSSERITSSAIPSAFRYFVSPRWQVKALATKNARHVVSFVSQDGLDKYSLENAILLSCTAATATSSNEELPKLQLEGMKTLCTILSLFGETCFDTSNGDHVADYCSSQVAAAIRHSLLTDGKDFEMFQAGCKCLRFFAKSIYDIGMFRRLIRPLLKLPQNNHAKNFPSFFRTRIYTIADLRYMVEVRSLNKNECDAFITEYSDIREEVAKISSSLICEVYSCRKPTNDNIDISSCEIELYPVLSFCSALSMDETVREKAIPILLSGLHNSLSMTNNQANGSFNTILKWIVCLNLVVESGFVHNKNDLFIEISHICENLSSDYLIPIIQRNDIEIEKDSSRLASIIVTLIENMCSIKVEPSANMPLLHAAIAPLSEQLVFNEFSCKLIRSIYQILQRYREGNENNVALIKFIFNLSSKITESCEGQRDVYHEASKLLQICVSSDFLDLITVRALARMTAKGKKWIAWRLICTQIGDGSGVVACRDILQEALSANSSVTERSTVIRELCLLVKMCPSNIPIINSIMNCLGALILISFQDFGNGSFCANENALMICTDIITIFSLVFQSLSRGEANEISQFITICVKLFAGVINVNGLPNQPKNGDVNKGRLCSAVLVHWARASPVVFKVCLTNLTTDEKSIVEHAVRSELSGHAQINVKPKILTPI